MTRNQPKIINPKQESRKINSEEKLVQYIRSMLGEPMITVDVSDFQIENIIDDTVRRFSDFAYGGEQTLSFILEGKEDIQDYRLDNRVQAIKSVSFGNDLGGAWNGNASSGAYLGPGWGSVGVGYVPYVTPLGEASHLESGIGGMDETSGVSGGVAGGISSGTQLDGMSQAYSIMTSIDSMQKLFARRVNYEFNNNTKILRIFERVSGEFMIEASVEYVPNPEYDEIYAHPWVKEYSLNKTKYLWGTVTGKYSQSLVGGAEINYADMKNEAREALDRLEEDLLNKYSEALGIFGG